jgi:TolB-like protein/Tfp pilus assembly protein PilF
VWHRIKQHKVVQWTLAYLALAYTLLHGFEMLTGSLGWSHGLLRLITFVLILGVPITITLAWYHGARGQQRASGTEVMIIALLLAVGGAVLWRDRSPDLDGEQGAAAPSPQPDADAELPTTSNKSIAVLPFVNMSSDKEQEYFSDGLSEELLNLLSKVPELRVAARTSSFYFKGKDAKLPDIARELRVAHLLEGSVRKSGARVKITVQLIRASDGYHQWSETYDRTLDDIFAVQEEIAAAVVAQMKITLLGSAPRVQKTSPEAYALFLQARQLARLYTRRGIEESIALNQRALAIDPSYAPAWNGLAANYIEQADVGHGPRTPDEAFRLAREAIDKALKIDPEYAEAYVSLGVIARAYDNDSAATAGHIERALALDPVNLRALSEGAYLLLNLGRPDDAIEAYEDVVARDPLDARAHGNLGWLYMHVGRMDEAVDASRTSLRLTPESIGIHYDVGLVMLLVGDAKAALAEMRLETDEAWRLAGLALAYHALGQRSASDGTLAELIDKHERSWSETIARVYAFRGESDDSFEWLHKAIANKDTGVWNCHNQPLFRNLHDDPRWLPFLRKIGKAPEQLAAIKFELKNSPHRD